MFESKINKLVENRKLLNNSDNFQEISKIWAEIKLIYEDCKNEINEIKLNLNKLNLENSSENAQNLEISFEDAYKEIIEITEKLKTVSVSEISRYIERLILLKNKCLIILKEEKAKIEEVR